ncbi:MAG TPA: FlgO family outer membrane protein [Deltaproteobacteria bacterium]|jgi:hypothetical protein|nr:FlgO family outer membrane protein [Deltaproteobacteria bacterium]HOI06591.1 FlgO family outer membrane protein [Deltaproteobacteria bacterium]
MRALAAMILALVLAGCTSLGLHPYRTDAIDTCADRLAEGIAKGLEESHMGMNLLVSTPVDAVTFHSSDFGLALQEMIISSLAQRNANVVDIQLRKEPYVNCEDGLISLSRDASRLRPDFKADVIVVSTYLAVRDDIVVTARAIDYTTNEVITSATTTLTRTPNIEGLLRNRDQFKLYDK